MSIFAAGHKLGKYNILRLLGSGGMADVYEAQDTLLGRHVAIKVLPAEYSRNDNLVRRFETEVKQSALLNHRGIVSVYDFGQEGPYLYYTMRLLTGGDLRKRIESGLTPFEALGLLRELADAFTHAHKRTVHRDVKPENIVFDEQGLPVLTDFGIAKALDSSTKVTATGVAVGTPRYLSPEQARGKPVDKRADIYSLGVILYEMLTGMPPYDGEEALAVIFKHVTEPIPALPDSLEAIQPLLNALMEKDPLKRLASCEDLIVELEALMPSFMPTDMGQTASNYRSSPWMPRMATPSPLRTPGGSSAPTPSFRTGNQPTVMTAPPVADQLPKRKSLFDQPGVRTGETYRPPEPPADDDRPVTSDLDSDDATIQRGRPKTPPPAARRGSEEETRPRTPKKPAYAPPPPPPPEPEEDEQADMTVKMSRGEKRGAPPAPSQRPAPKPEGQVFPPRARSPEEIALAKARERANAKPASKLPLIAGAAVVALVGIAGAAYFAGAAKNKAPESSSAPAPAQAAPAQAAPAVTVTPPPVETHPAAVVAAPVPAPAHVAPAPAAAAPQKADSAKAAAAAAALEAARKAEAKRQEELQRQALEKDAEIHRQAEAKAAAKKKQEDDAEAAAAAKKRQQEEAEAAATAKKHQQQEEAAAAKKRQQEEAEAAAATKKHQQEEAAAKKKADEGADTARQPEDDEKAKAASTAAARKRQQDEDAAEKARADQERRDEEAAAQAAAEAAKRRLEAKRQEDEEKAKKRASQSSGF